MAGNTSPQQLTLGGHSRDSSGNSSASSPNTPTFSTRSHNRGPSSTSSLASTPDSPVNVAKPPLHDLVEDPAETEDHIHGTPSKQYEPFDLIGEWSDDPRGSMDSHGDLEDGPFSVLAGDSEGPLCICDTSFCEHRARSYSQPSVTSPMSEWSPGDDNFSDIDLSIRSTKRRRSGEISPSVEPLRRLSRPWASISRRKKDQLKGPTDSVRSAPTSRPTSIRHPNPAPFDHRSASSSTPPITPVASTSNLDHQSTPKGPPAPVQTQAPYQEDPIAHRGAAATPLLPPMMDTRNESREQIQSPLQSPTVAGAPTTFAADNTPAGTPNMLGVPTPPLSSKPSVASFTMANRASNIVPSSEIPSMTISEEMDPWAHKLGHANFDIKPAPYMPDVVDYKACNKLREDWQTARQEYMRQAARIAEHYGPTSHTYKLTEQKWSGIEKDWRDKHAQVNAIASPGPNDKEEDNTPGFQSRRIQPLAEPTPLTKIPTLNDPQRSGKFPVMEDKDIVGPMVQYAKFGAQRQPSKRTQFLRLFTDPASLLGRGSLGSRR
ncbi:hypothetical protein MBLNU230_g1523t1 [Neophaeotheca triangularis]